MGTGTYFVSMNRLAHENQKVGLACAMAIVLLVILVICTVAQKLFFKYAFDDGTSDESKAAVKKRKKAEQANMLRGFLNTALVLIVVLTVSVFIGSMLAYVLNRFKFKGNAIIQNLFMFAALIPGIATQVTVYKIMYSLGLINHLYGYMIVLMGTDIISIYIFLQFFENLPVSLDESAIMDGCTYFGVFFKILFPLLKPAIVTTLVLKGVGVYNEYYMSNLYLQNEELKTISTALYKFTGPYGNQYNYICAGVLITIIPIFVLFLIFQKQIYSGMAAGAVKG